jgi:pimeloyl-ACP methyl ester carboxylesterase
MRRSTEPRNPHATDLELFRIPLHEGSRSRPAPDRLDSTINSGKKRKPKAAAAVLIPSHRVVDLGHAYGEHGSKMLNRGMNPVLAELDKELFGDPAWMGPTMAGSPEMFAFGVQGYADDRIADGPGWLDFDVAEVHCPVVVLQGAEDKMVDLIQARHTATIVPSAQLVVVDGGHGHFTSRCRCATGPTAVQQHRGAHGGKSLLAL